MKLTARQYAEALIKLSDGKSGKSLDNVIKDFVAWLAERHELSRVREIVRAVDNAWRRKYGASAVLLTTAVEPTKQLLDEVQKAFPHASLTHNVSAALMGGAIVQIDDRRFDGSVAGELERLKVALET